MLSTISLPSARRLSLTSPQLLSTERRICCTDRLVRIYNNTANAREREVLGQWFLSHVAVFGKLDLDAKVEVAEELARLANIKVRCPRDRKLVLRVVTTLGEAMTDDTRSTEPIAKAFSHALVSSGVAVFKDDPTNLLRLADKLIHNLRGCIVPIRQTFKHNHSFLIALNRICTLVHRITPVLPTCNRLKKLRDGLLCGLEIFRDAPYYPYRFHGILIEQSIHRFTEGNEPSALFDTMQRAALGTAGVLDLYRGVCQIDTTAVSEGLRRLKAACADSKLRRKLWFDWLQTLSFTTTLCLTDSEKFELFQRSLKQILEYQMNCIRNREERNAVRYGVVNELVSVATQAESDKVRREAMFEFHHLAACHALRESWDADPEVFEGLLDAASKIYQLGEFCEFMKPVLEMLTSSKKPHLRQTIRSWFENKTLDDKLESLRKEEEEEESPLVCHGLLLQRVSRCGFWLNNTVDYPSFAVNAVHQV